MERMCAFCKRFKANPERSITLKYKDVETTYASCDKCYWKIRDMTVLKKKEPQIAEENCDTIEDNTTSPCDIGTAASEYVE